MARSLRRVLGAYPTAGTTARLHLTSLEQSTGFNRGTASVHGSGRPGQAVPPGDPVVDQRRRPGRVPWVSPFVYRTCLIRIAHHEHPLSTVHACIKRSSDLPLLLNPVNSVSQLSGDSL